MVLQRNVLICRCILSKDDLSQKALEISGLFLTQGNAIHSIYILY